MGDTAALTGLRRLVLHSRDLLDENLSGTAWTGDKSKYAAVVLAREVLTLVGDCLPDDGEADDEK